jgi:hypothetical protein
MCFVGVHQVALLTHVDQVCQETARDITQVYNSQIVQQTVFSIIPFIDVLVSYWNISYRNI